MLKRISLVILLFLPIISTGQQLYDYYNGYIQGYKNGCECSSTPPNVRSLYYKNGTINEGYNAGFIDGRIFLNGKKSNSNETQLYSPDLNLSYQVLANKQTLLNERRKVIQKEYEESIMILYENIRKRQPPQMTEEEKQAYNKFNDLAQQYSKQDLANDSNYYALLKWFSDWKKYFQSL